MWCVYVILVCVVLYCRFASCDYGNGYCCADVWCASSVVACLFLDPETAFCVV